MNPIKFPGSVYIGKPEEMPEEHCSGIWAAHDTDVNGYPFFLTAWKPSLEELRFLVAGQPIYVKTIASGLPPMALFVPDILGNTTSLIIKP